MQLQLTAIPLSIKLSRLVLITAVSDINYIQGKPQPTARMCTGWGFTCIYSVTQKKCPTEFRQYFLEI